MPNSKLNLHREPREHHAPISCPACGIVTFRLSTKDHALPYGLIHDTHHVTLVKWMCPSTDCRRITETWEALR